MRIHRIGLRNFRGVVVCDVSFVSDGVTIVEGENEIGKTSLTEALDLALSELDSSNKARVKATQPVDRDVGPEVEVELSSGAYRLRLHKRWRRRPETTLEVIEPRHEQLTGREAHQRLRAILDETLDWHLWEALQVAQGAKLELPAFGVASLGAALTKEAADDTRSVAQDALWERICAERDRYWTSTGRDTKQRQESAVAVRQAQELLASLEASLREIEENADEHARLVQHHAQLEHDLNTARERESELAERWQRVGQLQFEANERNAKRRAALSERDQRKAEIERRSELVSELDRQDAALAALRIECETAAPALGAAVRRAEETAAKRDEAQGELDLAIAAYKLAREDRDHHRRLIEVDQFRERLARIEQAQAQLADADAVLADVRVDNDLVELIDAARIAVVRAEASAEGAAAHVTTTAIRAISIAVDGIDHRLKAEQQHDFIVSDATELKIDDSATVHVRAGKGSAETMRQLIEARLELKRLLDEGGVPDVASAQAAAKRRESAERERDSARTAVKENLRDLTHEELSRMADRHARRIEEYTADRADVPPLPQDLREAAALAAAGEAAVENLRATAVVNEEAVSIASTALTNAQLDAAESAGNLRSSQETRDQAAGRLAEARQQISDEDLATALSEADQALTGAATAADAVQKRLQEEEADSIEELLINARDTSHRMAREISENEGRQHELHGSLEARGEMGLASQRDDAEGALQSLERDHISAERKALAAESLYQAFDVRRREARQKYHAPFRDSIERLGKIAFNPTFAVELDDDLGISRRTLNGITLDVDQLSTGAREQLAIIARLACAAIVSPEGGGAPVVLDDALGWSDPSRLGRMGAAIASAGRHCQVIILTCTPGRYAHVGNANVVQLPSSPRSED
ncbi:MAG: hypothetical protein OXH42_07260 [Acidimicrobiaceae bacterium]|nr:hypothetical protein [Acidimicrobiaceae bacterium]